MFEKSRPTNSARDETSSFRNIRFKACLTEFSVIQRAAPISALVSPCATSSAISISLGHRDVRVMNGGRKKWISEGRPLVTEIPTIKTTTYTAQEPDSNIRALREQVQGAIGNLDRVLVDVRTPQEYCGELFTMKPPEGTQRAGHIPGAVHIFYELALNEDETFKSAQELYALYSSKGIIPDKEVITYCAIGARSAHTWFVLKYLLGYENVRNYDASWNEWGSLSDTPVEAFAAVTRW